MTARPVTAALLICTGLLAACGSEEPPTVRKAPGTDAERSILATVDRYNAGVGRTLGGDAACQELAARARTSVADQIGSPSCSEAITQIQAATGNERPHQLQVENLQVTGRTARATDGASPSAGSRTLQFRKTGRRWQITKLGVD